ncbi:hypothetical protein [Miltoncostaea marina]|uniref:hypothetical protein n=1 Tax=Miltoncostaea marina TaxID=2843215 RepID=UPI001C3CDEE7|nr:hypothetical protein [Miltoncostaea marina]
MERAASGGGSIWEDGLGRRDEDARVLLRGEVELTADPQTVRYGDGRPARAVVEAVRAGPAFRGRPVVDALVSEGLRPVYLRMSPEQARALAALLGRAADRAEAEGPGPAPPA